MGLKSFNQGGVLSCDSLALRLYPGSKSSIFVSFPLEVEVSDLCLLPSASPNVLHLSIPYSEFVFLLDSLDVVVVP